MPDPDIEPDIEIAGGTVIQIMRGGGGRSPKKLVSALWASVWSKNKGGRGPGPLGASPGLACVASVSIWPGFGAKKDREPKSEKGGGGGERRKLSFLPHPLPALLLAPSFARSLTLVPRSLFLHRTETLATQATPGSATELYHPRPKKTLLYELFRSRREYGGFGYFKVVFLIRNTTERVLQVRK